MSGVYADGATYGAVPDAQPVQEASDDPIHEDGAQYGQSAEQ
ncbi:hypothetical protein [Streptomyces sp. NPDC092903]